MAHLKEITIEKRATGGWVLRVTADTITAGECGTAQAFDDLPGFLLAVQEAGVFIGVRDGKIKSKDANERLSSRILVPNHTGLIQ